MRLRRRSYVIPTTNRKIMRAHGEDLNVNCQGQVGNGETAYDAVFAMASLSLGQDRYDFSLSARATAAFMGRLCQCACFQVGCLRKTDGTRDKGERKSHGEGEEQLMLLGATRSTRLRGSCAPSATSMMRSRWGSKAKRYRWYTTPPSHTSSLLLRRSCIFNMACSYCE